MGLHGIIHMMGLSRFMYSNWAGGSPVIRNNRRNYLASPKVKEAAIEYFGSVNYGVPLENNEYGVGISSHL